MNAKYRLKNLMEDAGVTFRQVSAGANISLSTLNKISHNENVEMEVIDRLLTFFDCEPGDLIIRVRNGDNDEAQKT